MKFIKAVSLVSLLSLSFGSFAEAEKSLAECGFPLAGEKFESNLKELLDVTTTPPEIPDYKCETKKTGYANLCQVLEANTVVLDDESPYSYEYEVELARLAKADYEKDGNDLFVKKINAYVTQCAKNLVCDTFRTRKKEISLLKVAVATANWDYVERVLKYFNYPINTTDDKDQMNLIDFVYDEYSYYKKTFPGSEHEKKLKSIYQLIKQSGGKHVKFPESTTV